MTTGSGECCKLWVQEKRVLISLEISHCIIEIRRMLVCLASVEIKRSVVSTTLY